MAGSSRREFDVVLYGASGFVGRQTVAYFARHAAGLRWATAGRDEARLHQALAAAGAADAGVIVADAQDATALDALAARTRVVLSTAGPFSRHGTKLVAACVARRTHYVDITGETPWVRELIDRHHAQAARDGTAIVPCCGFDSVPSDLGVWLLARALLADHGQALVEAKACFSMRGGINGGTVASMLAMAESGQIAKLRDPFLLNPAGTTPADVAAHADPFAPHRDDDFDAWLGPFVMGPINTRIVRRSAALLAARGDRAYAPGLHYQEYQRYGRGAVAALLAAGLSSGLGASNSLVRTSLGRSIARRFTPAPGAGPSERAMDGGWFRCELIGRGDRGATVRARVAGPGDPGNRATTRFVCEAARVLVAGDAQAGGVLTPASACGDALVERLRAAGMELQTFAEPRALR